MSEETQEARSTDVETRGETYNGWRNYPTWCVNLWLSNDEGLAGVAHQLAASEIRHDDEDHMLRVHCADAFRDWVLDGLAPDLGASFAADLLGYALDQVDWFEIADAWIASASE